MSLLTTIIGDIYKVNSTTLPVISYEDDTGKIESEPIIAVLDRNNQVVDTSNHTYIKIKDKESYALLIFYNLHSVRNIISATVFRSIMKTMYDRKYGEGDMEKALQINKVLSLIRTPSNGFRTSNDISEYINMFYASTLNQVLHTYTPSIKALNMTGVQITPRFSVVYVPRELQARLNDIGVYFEQLKNELHFNKDNGYYSISIRDPTSKSGYSELDILCRHEYMQLSGISNQVISLECYKDGKCRYCGQPMVPFVEKTSLLLPSRAFSVIYAFIETIKSPVNETILLNILTKFIIQELSKHEQVKTEDQIMAFTYLFLYRCYLASNDKIVYYITKIHNFVSDVKNKVMDLGIQKTKTDAIAKELFPDDKSFKSIFKDSAYEEVTFNDSFVYNILFSDPYMKKIQKIYEDGKMEEFNEMILIQYLSTWCYKSEIQYKKEVLEFKSKEPSNEHVTDNLLTFYKKTWKSYCPVNGIHEFKNKKCVYCGISEDGKNIESIFEKYRHIIGQTHVHEDNNKNDFRAKNKNEIDVSKYKDSDLFNLYIKNAEKFMEAIIMKGLKEHPEKMYNFICATLKINENEIKEPIKLLIYICANNYMSASMVLSSLLSAYAPIHKVIWM